MTFAELARLDPEALENVFVAAATPRLDMLPGWEWRGWNQPFFTKLLGIQKFIKGFFDGPAGVEGYNIPVRQGGFVDGWHKKGRPFGFYEVSLQGDALLLDYGASKRNAAWKPERVLRDYLVQPEPGNEDLLLGKAFLHLGGPRVFSNFFILERLAKTPWKP